MRRQTGAHVDERVTLWKQFRRLCIQRQIFKDGSNSVFKSRVGVFPRSCNNLYGLADCICSRQRSDHNCGAIGPVDRVRGFTKVPFCAAREHVLCPWHDVGCSPLPLREPFPANEPARPVFSVGKTRRSEPFSIQRQNPTPTDATATSVNVQRCGRAYASHRYHKDRIRSTNSGMRIANRAI